MRLTVTFLLSRQRTNFFIWKSVSYIFNILSDSWFSLSSRLFIIFSLSWYILLNAYEFAYICIFGVNFYDLPGRICCANCMSKLFVFLSRPPKSNQYTRLTQHTFDSPDYFVLTCANWRNISSTSFLASFIQTILHLKNW